MRLLYSEAIGPSECASSERYVGQRLNPHIVRGDVHYQRPRQFYKDCKGDMNCVYKTLNLQRRDPLWLGGPTNPDGLAWNDPILRQAEKLHLKPCRGRIRGTVC